MPTEPLDVSPGFLSELIDRAGTWAVSTSGDMARRGRALTPEEQQVAQDVGVAAPEDVRLVTVDVIPTPADPLLARVCRSTRLLGPDTVGLTLGHTICIRRDYTGDRRLFAHECCHVAQVERLGSLRTFLDAYVRQMVEYGYTFAPLEIEARQNAKPFGSGW